MTTIGATDRRARPTWSRRPFVGGLPKVFQSPLPAADVLAGLRLLADGSDAVGAVEGKAAWLRPRSAPPLLPATTLRMTVSDDEGGARIQCRFDQSWLDGVDLWVYTGATAVGFMVSGAWLSGHMPVALRAAISGGAPIFMGALAIFALGHFGYRRWRQAVRDRLFDEAMIAAGVPIE